MHVGGEDALTVTTPTYAPPPRPGPPLYPHMIHVFIFQYYRYTLFLAACQLRSGQTFCLLQGCENYVLNGQPVLNDYECPLVSFLLWIVTRLSVLYTLFVDCTDGCKFEEETD